MHYSGGKMIEKTARKTVFITGISGGIGGALLKKFTENGYFVIGQFCNNTEKINELKNSEIGKNCAFFQCDFSDIYAASSFARKICSSYPEIDCLINNAGITRSAVFQENDDAFLQKITAVNLLSPMAVTREVIKNMISRKSGCILNISSIWGTYGGSCEVSYSATKGGLISFTKALSRELGASNIRVNALSCGFIDTPMNSSIDLSTKDAFCDELSLGRTGKPEEVANAAFFLCSDASSYVTGQVLGVDGGF